MKGTDVFVVARSPWGNLLLRRRSDDETPGRKNEAKPADMMLQHNPGGGGYTGHTMIIAAVIKGMPIYGGGQAVLWYQGNLPAVIPELRLDYVANMAPKIYGNMPRRWNFNYFNK